MTRYTLIGTLACVGGAVLICFKAVSSAMGSKGSWQGLHLADVVGERYVEWTARLSLGGVERGLEYILSLPLYVLLFGIGGMFFVLDYFLGRR